MIVDQQVSNDVGIGTADDMGRARRSRFVIGNDSRTSCPFRLGRETNVSTGLG